MVAAGASSAQGRQDYGDIVLSSAISAYRFD
jgi:hypothetical protein